MPPKSYARPRAESAYLLVQSWSRRYWMALVAVAFLIVLHQAVVQPMLLGLSIYPPKINLAGRQRMLSQKISKEALALASLPPGDTHAQRRTELLDDLQNWKAVHYQLTAAEVDFGHREQNAIAAALHDLDAPLEDVVATATVLALREAGQVTEPLDLQYLLDREAAFLGGMEQVVAQLEQAAERELVWLRGMGLSIMAAVVVMLASVYFVVLTPATRLIRAQVQQLATSEVEQRQLSQRLARARDELEDRVAVRTRELSAANAALANEMAERKALEQRTLELGTQLAHAARITALGQLATGLAHEINQPLASIATFADTVEVLLESPSSDRGALEGPLAQIKQAALRAGAIVRRMRNFVRRGEPSLTRVDLNVLVRDVCELCSPQLAQAAVELSLRTSATPLEVEVDAIEIQQVVVNLIQNALQALAVLPRGDRRIWLTTSLVEQEGEIEIVDNGPGFSESALERSLAPYFTTKQDGLGMGLAISRTLLERYQGGLQIENRSAGGARVVLNLPLATSHEIEPGAATHTVCR
ncbi:MAG: type IV pili methyl-accepting chemotaxis transducer N-terminal domain-containing protein [Pirellulales bacterium]|nr:type IV pili methyl-accepting chemotaxis transducer N-terminal domain-containing protein [Pirellulales bacterium]